MYTKFLLSVILLLLFTSVNAQVGVISLFNSLSNNGFTNDTTGYQFEFNGQSANNCLINLGRGYDIQPINWNVSINEQNHTLVIAAKQNQSTPVYYTWRINNYFSDSACNLYGEHQYSADLSENLSISYRVKSNIALNSFSIAPVTWYWGGDYYGQDALPIYPTISLEPDEWKIVDFDLCINSSNWEEVTSTLTSQYGKYLIYNAVGIRIDVNDPIVKTNRDIVIEIDYVRIGKAAGDCPTMTTGVNNANSQQKNSVLTFPNPFHDYLQLSVQSDIEYVEILNMNQEVLMKIENDFDQKINTSNLIAGMYLIKYHSLDGSINMSKAIKN